MSDLNSVLPLLQGKVEKKGDDWYQAECPWCGDPYSLQVTARGFNCISELCDEAGSFERLAAKLREAGTTIPVSEAAFPEPSSLGDLLNEPEPDVEWLAPPVVPAGGNVLVAGYPKSFKTFFALDLAVSQAAGTPHLGRFTPERCRKVGIVLMEGLRWQAGRRLARICEAHGVRPAEAADRIYVWYRPPLKFDFATVQELGGQARDLGIEVLIVDAWSYVATGSSDSADEVTPQLMAFSSIRNIVPGLTCILIHHARKAKDVSDERVTDLIRGSGAFGAWFDCGIVLSRKDEQSPVAVRVELRDYLTPAPFTFTVSDEEPAGPHNGWRAHGALRLKASDKTPAELAAEQRAEEIVLDVLVFVHENDGCTKTDIETGIRRQAGQVRHARDLAVRRGLMEDGGAGAGAFRASAFHVTDAGRALIVPSSQHRPDDGVSPHRPIVPPPVGGEDGRWTAAGDDR